MVAGLPKKERLSDLSFSEAVTVEEVP